MSSSGQHRSLWGLLPLAIFLVAVVVLALVYFKPWELLPREPDLPVQASSEIASMLEHNRCDLTYALPGPEATLGLANQIAIEVMDEIDHLASSWVLDSGVLKLAVIFLDGEQFVGVFCWHRQEGELIDLIHVAPFDGTSLLFIQVSQ